MSKWLASSLAYLERWIEFQLRQSEQPGCAIAVAHKGKLVFERALGHADLGSGTPLEPRHRFRVASHSKSFTAAGIMRLRELGKVRLDDRVGRYVGGLHPKLAQATIAQILSHSAGIFRDGTDCAYWLQRRPFPGAQQVRTELAAPPTIEPSTRFKYSNHGYALAGFIIEAVSGESYAAWMTREIIERAGLAETAVDTPLPRKVPLAHGHSSELPLGRRVSFSGAPPTHALAPATGFVSTAADIVRFFAQLSPTAKRSILSAPSRREMVRGQWRDRHSSLERSYGLGIISGKIGDWEWFGHSGAFPGFLTRTCVLPEQELTISVLTNAIDGLAHPWLDGAMHIFRCFAQGGAPSRRLASWAGRWWTIWGVSDLVPVGDKVLVATPALLNPFLDASELEIAGRDRGRVALAGGFINHGEPVRRVRTARAANAELWLGGVKLVPEAKLRREMEAREERTG